MIFCAAVDSSPVLERFLIVVVVMVASGDGAPTEASEAELMWFSDMVIVCVLDSGCDFFPAK